MPLRARVLGHFGLLDRSKPGGVAAVALPFSALPPASKPPPALGGRGCHFEHIDDRGGAFPQRFPATGAGRFRVGLETQRNWQLRAARRPTIGRIEEQREGKTVATSDFFFSSFFFLCRFKRGFLLWGGDLGEPAPAVEDGNWFSPALHYRPLSRPGYESPRTGVPEAAGTGGRGRGPAAAHLHPTSLSSLPRSLQSFPAFPFSKNART